MPSAPVKHDVPPIELDVFLPDEYLGIFKDANIGLCGPKGNEVSGKGYARQPIKGDQWTVEGGSAWNNEDIIFPEATKD